MATYITKPSYYNVIGGFKPSMRESGIGAKALILDYVPGSRIVDLKLLGSILGFDWSEKALEYK